MKRSSIALFDSPTRCILLVAVLLSILLPGLFHLEIDGTTRSMYPEKGKLFDWQREFSANFSTDTALIVVVRAENIFDRKSLESIQEIASAMEELEVVATAQHLFSIQYPKRYPGGFRLEPLLEEIPHNAGDAEKLREEILSNPILRGFIVNESGTATALYPTLNTDLDVPNYQKYVVETLESLVASARSRGVDAYLAGGPVIANAVIGHIWHDLSVLGPAALIVVATMIFLLFRWKIAVLFNLCTGTLSVAATFGFMGLSGIEITSLVSILMMLILILGCTEDIHILAEYVLGVGEGLTKDEALKSMKKTVFSALILTSLSTAAGFYVSAISPIPALQNFAIASGTGIVLNFVITILLTPVFLRIGKPGLTPFSRSNKWLDRLSNCSVSAATRFAKPFALGAGLFVAFALFGLSKISVDNNFLHFFTDDSPVKICHNQLEEDFGGRAALVVTVETGSRQGVWQPENILQFGRFQDQLGQTFEHVSGFSSYLREYLYQRGEISDRENGELIMSEDHVEICRAIFGNRFLGKYIDFDGSRTAIWIRATLHGSKEVRAAQERINILAENYLPSEWKVRVLGEPVSTALVTDSITSELISSLFLLTTVVTIILILYFRSWKLGLLAIIPNLFPVVSTFGFMGWAGIPMGTGTFAVAMAAFGIAVDDTIHLIVRFTHESKQDSGNAYHLVLRRVLSKELFPVLATSMTLISGFGILLLSDFQVHRETGILFIIAISTAMLADLFVTPLILKLSQVTAKGER